MSAEDEFARLLEGLRSSSSEAAIRVVNQYGDMLLREAVRRLRYRRDPGYGPEDVLQSVYRSFFARVAAGQFDIRSTTNVVGILVVMTRRKCRDRIRGEMAGMRDRSRLVPSVGTQADPANASVGRRGDPVADAVVLIDLTEKLLRDLPTARHRRVAELLLCGCDAAEICSEVNRAGRSVRRITADIARHLARILGSPPAGVLDHDHETPI